HRAAHTRHYMAPFIRASVSSRAKDTVRKTPGGPAASTLTQPLTSSGRLSGTNTKRPAVLLRTRSGVRSASQTARTIAAGQGGPSAGSGRGSLPPQDRLIQLRPVRALAAAGPVDRHLCRPFRGADA